MLFALTRTQSVNKEEFRTHVHEMYSYEELTMIYTTVCRTLRNDIKSSDEIRVEYETQPHPDVPPAAGFMVQVTSSDPNLLDAFLSDAGNELVEKSNVLVAPVHIRPYWIRVRTLAESRNLCNFILDEGLAAYPDRCGFTLYCSPKQAAAARATVFHTHYVPV